MPVMPLKHNEIKLLRAVNIIISILGWQFLSNIILLYIIWFYWNFIKIALKSTI